MVYLSLGEVDTAFEWFEKAYDEHDPNLLGVITIPCAWSVRFYQDPRSVLLLEKMGLSHLAPKKEPESNSIFYEILPTKFEKSIVVLPFDDVSPDKDNEYFSDGMTEEIITDLSKIRSLRVISRNSAMMFKGSRKATKTIGRELDVEYVLEGSVRKAGNNLRITAQLIEAAYDAHLWAEKYSGTLDDVFEIQEKVSRSIVEALKLKLSPEENKKIAEKPIKNIQAYECYLKARQEIWKWTEDSLECATQNLKKGMDIIGENILLYAGMGYVYWTHINIGIKPKEEYLNKAEECAKKIFDLEPESAHAYRILGLVQTRDAKPKQAVINLKRALTIDPNDPDALFWLCCIYCNVGKSFAAVPLAERLLKIDPLNSVNYLIPGWIHHVEGRFNLALEDYRKMYEMEPENPPIGLIYPIALVYNKYFKDAYTLLDLHIKRSPQHIFSQMGKCLKYALQGEKVKAIESLSPELKSKARTDPFNAWIIADCDALNNEKEEAIDSLESAVNQGFINYPLLSEYDPFLENIRGEERFKKLMERVKHEWENFEV